MTTIASLLSGALSSGGSGKQSLSDFIGVENQKNPLGQLMDGTGLEHHNSQDLPMGGFFDESSMNEVEEEEEEHKIEASTHARQDSSMVCRLLLPRFPPPP